MGERSPTRSLLGHRVWQHARTQLELSGSVEKVNASLESLECQVSGAINFELSRLFNESGRLAWAGALVLPVPHGSSTECGEQGEVRKFHATAFAEILLEWQNRSTDNCNMNHLRNLSERKQYVTLRGVMVGRQGAGAYSPFSLISVPHGKFGLK